MRKMYLILVLILVAVFIAPACMAAYQVGDTVANFTLNDAYGQSVSLDWFQGMAVLINFWGSG